MAGWYAGGRELGVALGLAAPEGGAADRRLAFLERVLPVVLRLLSGRGRTFRGLLAERRPAPVVALVDPRLGADPLHHLLPGRRSRVAINDWYGPFFDLIQAALGKTREVTIGEFYAGIATFLGIALVAVCIGVLSLFFISHYVFRWRNGDERLLHEHWPRLRHIEGASQRVQDDTMRFSSTDRGPRRQPARRGDDADRLPAGPDPPLGRHHRGSDPRRHPLPARRCRAALVGLRHRSFSPSSGSSCPASSSATSASRRPTARSWSTARTTRPAPTRRPSRMLFANVRRNYFRLYFHYMYFNVARIFYLQIDNVFGYVILAPTIVAGAITLGLMNQILNALGQVRTSFQYLVNSWTTVGRAPLDLQAPARLRGDDPRRGPALDRQRVPRSSPRPGRRRAPRRRLTATACRRGQNPIEARRLRMAEGPMSAPKKVVLAYSGGLDTSIILKWLQADLRLRGRHLHRRPRPGRGARAGARRRPSCWA